MLIRKLSSSFLNDTVVLATGDGLQMDTYLAHIDRYEYTFALEMEAFVERVREGAATPTGEAQAGVVERRGVRPARGPAGGRALRRGRASSSPPAAAAGSTSSRRASSARWSPLTMWANAG